MPWVEVTEPWAKPPRWREPAPATTWAGPLEVDRAWAELAGVTVEPGADLELSAVTELSISDSAVAGATLTPTDLGGAGELALEIHRSRLDDCDLSGTAIRSLQSSTLQGCKVIGIDLAGATVSDVTFERCLFRYANLRMARLRRVRFDGCRLDDIDGYRLDAEDVSLPGCELSGVNLDQLQASRLDLRHATELGFSTISRLDGCLMAEHQLVALAPALAMAAGVDVERG